MRWVGSDGAIAIGPDGSEGGAMNGGAPEMSLPDWSSDPAKAAAHASDYWLSMGVESCQLTGAGIDSSGGGSGSSDGGSTTYVGSSTVAFARSVGGIPVEESLAVTRFDSHDQTTQEAFYWPEIPADVVSAAFALKAQLADPAALAAYKAKLPSDAQGQGRIVIHHSRAGSMSAFQSAATYEVTQANSLGDGGALNFDASGKLVATIW